MTRSAHIDTFARDHLPPADQQPEFRFDLPELQFAPQLNCATELLDRRVQQGEGERRCAQGSTTCWSYRDLQAHANRMARVLVEDMGLVPGNRVLLRGANSPQLAACWFAVVKAGGIVVATMPLLRAKELTEIITKARISHALCDARIADELLLALPKCPMLAKVAYYNSETGDDLDALAARKPDDFENVATAADDTCLIAFTSGTTGTPKATMHFHRDVMAACACWPAHMLRASSDDIFIGSPPLAFTFGLGGLLLFPMSIGASTVLLEKATPHALLEAIERYRATVCFTAPTSYRAMASHLAGHDVSSLRKCVSAAEPLPAAPRQLWKDATGIEILDGIGATEMFHIFISSAGDQVRRGAIGKVVPGYRARVVDDSGQEVPRGTIGKLAVLGPTGCRYLGDARQTNYVKGGWNYPGDAFIEDADGYFFYQSRDDDMIITSGYNVGGPEVEDALLKHPAVAECAVIGKPDAERGMLVKAFCVLKAGEAGDSAMVKTLQDHVKAEIAPYKYPREIEFVASLPRTETGKLQRFRLRQSA